MPKKEIFKKTIPKKIISPIKKPASRTITPIKPNVVRTKSTERILVENFVSLQKVMTNLSFKFDELSTQISKLLELFEISARTIAERNPERERGSVNVEEKLSSLIDQNKVIARGLTLLHETNSSQFKPQPPHQQPQEIRQIPPPLSSPPPMASPQPNRIQPPRDPSQPDNQGKKPLNMDEYQKSISSKIQDQNEP